MNVTQKIILGVGAVVMALAILRVPVISPYSGDSFYVWVFRPFGRIDVARLLVPVAAVGILTAAGMLLARRK